MEKNLSRRNFLQKSVLTAGAATIAPVNMAAPETNATDKRLPREVWIATLSQMDMKAETAAEMVDMVFDLAATTQVYQPDVISLPEIFPFWGVSKKYNPEQRLGKSKYALERASEFSKSNNCYSINPVYTTEDGRIYNAAVIFDRNGKKIGEYRKAHPTESELAKGLSPGPIDAPVFKTDFGTIGVQICFDLLWDDAWAALRKNGAEMVFFASAFPGGQMVNAKAWQHKYIVASSTCKHTAKICDITGEVVESTGIWNANAICAPVNLEKALLHIYPYYRRFDEIQKRYGRDVRITIYHEEEWAIIESLSPDVKVRDILNEYELKTHEELTSGATMAQDKAREIT